MHRTAQDAWLFGTVYNAPPCGNISGCIVICIHPVATMFTTKAFPFSFAYIQTFTTHLRSIGWWNSEKPDPGKPGLIFQILTELVKTPSVQLGLLYFAFWLCRFADITQILNGYPFVFGFCLSYNLFAYRMIVYGNEPAFPARKPFQELFRPLCAFALNACSYSGIFFSNLFKCFAVVICAIRKSTNIGPAKIASDKVIYFFNSFFRYLNCLEKKKLPFSKYQIGFPFYIRKIFTVMANKWDSFQSAIHCLYGNTVLCIRKYPGIKANCPHGSELPFCFPVPFIGISNFRDTSYNHLSRKIRACFDTIVSFVMEFKLVENPFIPGYFRNGTAGCIGLNNGSNQGFRLIYGWQQLYPQNQFHMTNINHFIKK
jgi:hypothetical protein